MRIIFQAAVVIDNCQRVLTEVLKRESSYLVALGLIFVALYCKGAVLLRALVILKGKLGYRAVEIRVGKVWLRLYRLIEVLDGEHVVLHRHDISADDHDLFGVDLGVCPQPRH